MPAPPAFQQVFGVAVKRHREELELTQEQVYLRTGIQQRYLSNVENGKRNPSLGSIRRLAAGLGLSASELLRTAEEIEAAEAKSPTTR